MAPTFFDHDYLWPFTIILVLLPAVYIFWSKTLTNAKTTTPAENKTQPTMVEPLLNPHVQKSQVNVGEVRVAKILVHPLKSCRGTSVTEARYTPRGLQYDRDWCIIDAETHDVLTARTLAETVLVVPRLEFNPFSPYGGYMVVTVPKGTGYTTFSVPISPTPDVLASWPHIDNVTMFKTFKMDGYICQPLKPSDPSPSDVLSEYFKRKVLLMMKGPEDRCCPPTSIFPTLDANVKYQDAYPLLIVSLESLQALNEATGKALVANDGDPSRVAGLKKDKWQGRILEIERFRPNIVLKGAGVPFAEDLWREVAIGNNKENITVVCRCARCLLPNVDTKTGERDTAVPYKVMLKFGTDPTRSNKPMFGCNGVPSGNGVVRVGDKISVRRWIEQVDQE